MKKSKMIGAAMVALLLCAGFTSCSDDNTPVAKEKKLVRVAYGTPDMIYDDMVLSYDNQGRLNKAVQVSKDDETKYLTKTYDITWKDNVVDVDLQVKDQDGGDYIDENCTLTLQNGLVSQKSGNFAISFNEVYSYDRSGRLIKYESFSADITLQWKNDKLIDVTHDMSSFAWTDTHTYGTDSTPKGYNPVIPTVTVGDPIFLAHPELCGVKTAELPVRHVSVYQYNGIEDTSSTDYSYEFDKDGYLTKVNMVTVDHAMGETYHAFYMYTWK